MAQKVNPNLYRIGVQQMWKSLGSYQVYRDSRHSLLKEIFIRKTIRGYLKNVGYLSSEVVCMKSNVGYCVSATVFPNSNENFKNSVLKLPDPLNECKKQTNLHTQLKKGVLSNLLKADPDSRSQINPNKHYGVKLWSQSNVGLLEFTLGQILSSRLKERVEVKLWVEKSYTNNIAIVGEGLVALMTQEPYSLNKHLDAIKLESSKTPPLTQGKRVPI